MQEVWERVKGNADATLATLAGILSIVALIVAIAGTTGVARDEAQEMIDDAVIRVVDPAGYTQRVVQEAIDRYDADGRDASIAYHQSTESIDGPWYVFLLDENGFVIANPARPDFVGTTPAVRSDITGKPYGLEVVAADEDGRWVDYVFVNPVTGEPERKHTWVIKHDGLSFASGWYEPISRADDPATYTQAVVAGAISRYEAGGREASIAYHQSTESIDGPWYVFLLDEDGYVLANPARPDFVGTTPAVRSDITGKPYGLEVVAADEDGRWVDYVFVNPSTGEPERKHTWVIKHDGLSFASGWYEPISRADDPATFTQAFVARAVSRYNAEGLDATVAHYNTPESLEGQWYVFIFDEADRLLTHPDPNLLGDDLKGSAGNGHHGACVRSRDAAGRRGRYLGELRIREPYKRAAPGQALLGRAARRSPLRVGVVRVRPRRGRASHLRRGPVCGGGSSKRRLNIRDQPTGACSTLHGPGSSCT